MINLDYSIVYQVVLFLVLWVILNKILFQPYLRLLREREKRTTGAQHDSADLEHEGATLKAQYEESIAQGRAAGYAGKDTILQDARQRREKIIAHAREEASSTLERVRQEIASALEQEKRIAATEAAVVAGDMVAKVLGRRVA